MAPSDVIPCQHYRAEGPARALAAAGELEFKILPNPPALRYAIRRHGPAEHEPVGLAEAAPDVDVIVLVRGVMPVRIHDVIRFLQREGIAVVVDYDDAYDRLPPALHQLYKINPNRNPYYNWKHAKEAAKLADVVTVSTPALQRYRPDAIVIRNCIPRRYLELTSRRTERLTVGWAGTVYGHPGDLRVCGVGVAQAVHEFDARFLNVGDGVDIKRDLNLRRPPEVTGIVPFEEYPAHLTRMHVGIAPLKELDYSQSKSALKPLETLGAGAQYVASPTSEYVRLQRELEEWCALAGVPVPGAIAGAKSKEWRRAVSAALARAQEDPEAIAGVARRFVEERYLLEDRAVEWADAWEKAIKLRRSKRRRAA